MTAATLLATLPLLTLLAVALPLPRPFPCAATAARDSLPRGASIAVEDRASAVLHSPDGTFACGFYSVSPTVFTFSVWFSRAADRTVVWTANRARPVHSQASRLPLDGRRGVLVLTDYDGEVVWKSTTASAGSSNATRARLHDSGNLAVEDARGNALWQSFDHPTDTLLPTQCINKQGKGECYPKSLMFNGRTFPGLNGTAYLKVPADFDVPEVHVHQWQAHGASGLAIQEDIVRCDGASLAEFSLNVSDTSSTSGNQGKSIWFYFYGFLSAFFVIEMIVIAFGCWLFSNKGVFRPSEALAVEEGYRMITSHFRAYSYSELERATRKFCNEIGCGGSGTVYKGILDDERVVAKMVAHHSGPFLYSPHLRSLGLCPQNEAPVKCNEEHFNSKKC